MIIKASGLGKRFNKEWIFKDLNYIFPYKSTNAIIGANGSGKSTLLQVISGIIPYSQGKVEYHLENQQILSEEVYQYFTFLSPYEELIEELTLKELLTFHIKFRKLENNLTIEDFSKLLNLYPHYNKPIQYFSSGMKQRVKLGLALFFESKVLLLDEPTVNLDKSGIEWFRDEISKQVGRKTIIICSNQEYEYDFCKKIISISDYKIKA